MTTRAVDTTITYLVMSEPPARLPPMPVSPRLALMKAEHIPLHYYRYLYSAVGANWLWIERHQLDDNALAQKIRGPGVDVFVLYANGSPGGYYELDLADLKRAKLVYFGLTPEWTGQGIGPWLLGCAVSEAFSRGAEQLLVNTCTLDHPAALPLYQRIGFKPVRREERRVRVPAEIAIPHHIAARIEP
jgi:GNAT superfamily N-acetyltransferase